MEFTTDILHVSAYLGAGISMGVAALTCALGSGFIAGTATKAIMKQPESQDTVVKTMLIGQAVTESGGIFALVISLLLLFGGFDIIEGGWIRFAALLAAGITMGLGAVGPSLGAGYAGGEACESISRMPKNSMTITGNMLIGQAMSQTSCIFALLISLLLLYSTPLQVNLPHPTPGSIMAKSLAYLGAAFAIGLGTFGPGVGIGNVAGKACKMLGRFPKQRPFIMRTMFLGAAVSESTAIYSLIIAFLCIFAVK
jgi:F0F1-type ATP synthase membrane subunit c/vacuolar-type H+-ATPase subunit K